MRISLPSRSEQLRIATLLGAIDELIEINNRRIEVLEDLARSLYREWFVRFRFPGHEGVDFVDSERGPMPDGWEMKRSSDLMASGVLDIGDGYRAKNAEFASEGVPFVRVADIRNGELSTVGCDLLPPEYLARLGAKVSRVGDVVISMKGTVGRSAAVHERTPRVIYSPQVSYWRSLDQAVLPAAYLRCWIDSVDFRTQCALVKGSTDMADYVNLRDQRRMHVMIPTRDVLMRFGLAAAAPFECADGLRTERASLARTRDLLLPRLVTGRLDISDVDLGDLLPAEVA
jgi:type I restriction enzyme S subunit